MANSTEKIAVLGAGTMGAGIAQVAAQAGFETLLYDVKQEFIDVGLGRVKSFLKGSRERGKISAEQEEEILDRFHTSTKPRRLPRERRLVIEAAPEKLELKRDIFKQLDAICGAGDACWRPILHRSTSPRSPPRHSIRSASWACIFSIRRR